jgi:glutamate-5-semialdehyde dehydrogenase
MNDVATLCRKAKDASRALAPSTRDARDGALRAIAQGLRARVAEVLAANAADVEDARARGTAASLVDRLALDAARIEQTARGAEDVAALPDPLERVLSDQTRADGLRVRRVTVPLGVIAMVYEARPNVTVDASALCLKAGNGVVLRGGSEAARSNRAIAAVIADALERSGLPRDAVQVLAGGGHDEVRELVQQAGVVDLAIPRGRPPLIAFVREHARVPVIAHEAGVCHLYVDRGADPAMAARLAVDSKLRRPGVCNALECLLVDAADAERLLPPVAAALMERGCELRGCARTLRIVPAARPAGDDDWGREYLDRILAVRVVDGIDGAIAHVARYGSGHTDAICTADPARGQKWRREVDSACVLVNASTGFHDGGELGLGAEIGISTSKVHWRGAMGLESLTSSQWRVDGDGQTRG